MQGGWEGTTATPHTHPMHIIQGRYMHPVQSLHEHPKHTIYTSCTSLISHQLLQGPAPTGSAANQCTGPKGLPQGEGGGMLQGGGNGGHRGGGGMIVGRRAKGAATLQEQAPGRWKKIATR